MKRTMLYLTASLALLLIAPLTVAQTTPSTPAANPAAPRMHAEGRWHHGRHGGIEQLDRDRDGRISRAEFDARVAQRASQQGDRMHDRQPPDFAAIDRNHDGYVVASEVRAYHERMRPQREVERRKRFEEHFAQTDLNHDGRLGRVEVSEKSPRLARHFAWLDENRDGFLSRSELQAAHRDRH